MLQEKKQGMQLWHGLPLLEVEHKNGERFWAFYTNINREMFIGRLRDSEINFPEKYDQAKRENVFDCLNKKQDTSKFNSMGIVLCLTENCNLRCRYCFLNAESKGKIMPLDIMRDAIKKGAEIASEREIVVAAFGGEPCLEPSLLHEMVDYTKSICNKTKQKYSFAITTNGIMNKDVMKLLMDNKFFITISMDGIPEIQNYQRPLANGMDTYDLVEKNIKTLVDSRRNLIKIRSTITKKSVNTMPEQVRLLSKLKLNYLHFGIVIPSGRGKNADVMLQAPSSDEFIDNLKKSIELGKQLGVNVIAFPYMGVNVAPLQYCDGNLQNRIVVGASGDVSGCLEVQSKEHELFDFFKLGYYNEQNKELCINCKKTQKKQFDCADFNNAAICTDCPLQFFCGDGCPNHNYRLTGSFNHISEYNCKITKAILPYVLRQLYHSTYGE